MAKCPLESWDLGAQFSSEAPWPEVSQSASLLPNSRWTSQVTIPNLEISSVASSEQRPLVK